MKYDAIKRCGCIIFLSFLTFSVSAEGLSEYLQNPVIDPAQSSLQNPTQNTEASQIASNTSTSSKQSITNSLEASPENPEKDFTQLKNIIELVVAGIVAAALIIIILVIFLGRWVASSEKKRIKAIRVDAEENSEHITSAATSIREQEKETTVITQNMRTQATELSTQQKQTEQFSKEVIHTSKKVKEHEKEINDVTSHVKENMSKIQKYWDNQVNETVDTISLFQHNLSENINMASEGLEKINEQKDISDELLKDFLNKHNQQNSLIDSNTEISDKVSANLELAYKESNKLLKLLQKQQEQAERSLNEYSERLNNFEEQAYEQFDTSFQVADLARQELSANLDENRKHIETMRRQEEQSHGLNNQIAKNLETLDYSKIVKISQTLDITQDMFDEIHHKVDDTRIMLEELKQIEEEIKQTASNVESVAKNHAALEQHEAEIDQQINALVDANSEAEDSTLAEDISTAEKELAEGIVDALDNPSENIRGNTTVAISDYKMASGDSSTPLSFFRDIKKTHPTKN
jgi:chromosome segregation ATPase